MIKTTSLTLLRTESLQVKLSVSVLNGLNENNVYRMFSNSSYDYLTVEPSYYIGLQYKPNNNLPWNTSMTCRIDRYSIVTVRQELRKFYAEFSKPDTFIYYTSGNLELSEFGVQLSMSLSLKGGNMLTIKPKVIIDNNSQVLIPGVELCINFTEYACDLSSDEFEALVDIFSTINMRAEAMQLINTTLLLSLIDGKNYISDQTINAQEEQAPVRIAKPKPKSIFDRKPKEAVDDTVDRLVKESTLSSLDDL
jgi:hypothetical protein